MTEAAKFDQKKISQYNAYFLHWLIACCSIIVLIIFVGGLTRLTGSGLSIVEWKPITGIIPPLTDASWLIEFDKYKTSPEYQILNFNMDLGEFKRIFYLEFIHRFLGRSAGVIYLLPLIYFFRNGVINTKNFKPYALVLILFCVQGLVGWYMVKSGLAGEPHVSHFRLAAHLIIAVIIYNILFMQLLDHILGTRRFKFNRIGIFAIVLIYCQIILGAFVAGLHAGLIYTSFPLMGTSFIASEIDLYNINLSHFNDPVFVQFMHRINAYILSIVIFKYAYNLFQNKGETVALVILGVLGVQMLFGILTLIYSVPIILALLHQIGAILLLSVMLVSIKLQP